MDFGYILFNGYFECFNKKYFDRELLRTLKRLEEEGFQNDEVIDNFQIVLDSIKKEFLLQFQDEFTSYNRFFESDQYKHEGDKDKIIFLANLQRDFIEANEGYVPPLNLENLDIRKFSIKPDSLWRKGIIKLTFQNKIYLDDIEIIQENIDKIKSSSTDTKSGLLNKEGDIFEPQVYPIYNGPISFWDIVLRGYALTFEKDFFLDHLLRECKKAELINYSKEEFLDRTELVIDAIMAINKRAHKAHLKLLNYIRKPRFPYFNLNKKIKNYNVKFFSIDCYSYKVIFKDKNLTLEHEDIFNIRNAFIDFTKIINVDHKIADKIQFLNNKPNTFQITPPDIKLNKIKDEPKKNLEIIRSEINEIIKTEEGYRGKSFFLNDDYKEIFLSNISNVIINNSLEDSDSIIYLSRKSKTIFGHILGKIHSKYRQSEEYHNFTSRAKDKIFLSLMRTVFDWKNINDDNKLADKLKDTSLRPSI